MKTWKVHFTSVDMCAEREETIIVKSNTSRKAQIKAEEKMKKEGHKYYHIVLVNEINEGEE